MCHQLLISVELTVSADEYASLLNLQTGFTVDALLYNCLENGDHYEITSLSRVISMQEVSDADEQPL